MDNPKIIAKYIHCLSILEDNTALLYNNLSCRVEIPLVKSLLLSISKDSSKHSALLKGIANSMSDSKQNPKECIKNLGKVWSTISDYLSEVKRKEKMNKLSFSELLPTLNALESSLGEEYYIFVQLKTLQLMGEEINQIYSVNLDKIKNVFEGIIRDEDRHREILATIKDIIEENSEEHDNTPKVKYQNPDAWVQSLQPSTYDSI